MRTAAIVTMLAMAVLGFGQPVMAAEKCPVDDAATAKAGGYANAVEAAVQAAPDCDRAYSLFAACQLGSSADNALADIVLGKCEPLFMPRASSGVRQAYAKAKRRCNAIAEKNQGTMYQGLAAVCQAASARNFARKSSTMR